MHIEQGSEGLAVKDVQERLLLLDFNLGGETQHSVFGPVTAAAVAGFRERHGLPAGTDVDLDTWTALVDATFTFGDRLLYLRLPHFHGRDVLTLQSALASLGFSCNFDGIFGGHTERAVREFQQNAGLSSDGIVGYSTFSAINHLRHAWEGKDPLLREVQSLGFARAAEALEGVAICIYGTDEVARRIAERISNLAMATTSASRVVCAQSLAQVPDDSTLMIELFSSGIALVDLDMLATKGDQGMSDALAEQETVPLVVFENDLTINARLATALESVTAQQPRIKLYLAYAPHDGLAFSAREEQHAAIALLDAICLSFTVQ
ncbi:MAG: peptidoglycan-binding protein [Coriobacteriia bacterium]|nr:peptidoglycan-binding protein [Coriobacteriia bacterium]